MKEEKEKKSELKTIEVLPLKDHVLFQNEFYYDIKKGVKILIDKKFVQTLLTEKVINKEGIK